MQKITKRIIFIFLLNLILLSLSACNSTRISAALPPHIEKTEEVIANNDPSNDYLVDPDPTHQVDQDDDESSPTEIPKAPTEIPKAIWGDYPAPTVSSYIAIPPPVGIYPQPDNQINFLLLGSDQRPNEYGFRTDTILLGTINLDTKEVNLVSIPRDLYVYIPGYALDRINTTFVRGDEETLRLTFEYNFGVKIDNYMVINFNGFKDLIDILGGIDVIAGADMTDKHPTEGDNYTVEAGVNHMDGETALFYVRARKNSSDFDRARRQQEVIRAILDRVLNFNVISSIPKLYNQLKDTIQTDLSIADIAFYTAMIPSFSQIDNLSMYKIGPDHTYSWINPSNGADILIPIHDSVQSIIKQSINSGE